MYPILFDVGSITVYSYGFMIAIGIVAGMAYLIIQGKKEVGLTFDQGNSLFLFIFFAAFAGGKLFHYAATARSQEINYRLLLTIRAPRCF